MRKNTCTCFLGIENGGKTITDLVDSIFVSWERYRESSDSTNENDAKRLLKRRLGEMGIGQFRRPKIEKTTFDDLSRLVKQDYALNKRRSMVRPKTALVYLNETFGTALARDITLDRLTAYATERLAMKAAPASVKYELAILRRAFRLAHRAGKAIVPPFPCISVHKPGRGFSSEMNSKRFARIYHRIFNRS